MKKAKKIAVIKPKKAAPVKAKGNKRPIAKGAGKPLKAKSGPAKAAPVKKAPTHSKNVKLKTAPPVKAALKPAPMPVKAAPEIKAPIHSKNVKLKIDLALKSGLKPLPKPLPSEVKEEKKPKELYTIEYLVGSSPDILFEFISTAAGLEKWFARKVNVQENVYTFIWDKDEQEQARLIAIKDREFARFHWLGKNEKRYFEFRIQIDDLTGEVGLIVSDFADNKNELESARREWDLQIHNLQHALGSP
ncbi:MAG: hypothetical protein HKL88_03990 [Bacteroidia bacterium]|nr:hypothetical protein [Bacteroidia bacterium]